METPHGLMQVHAYPYGPTRSTFIVDMRDPVWRAAGFRSTVLEPGESDGESIDRLQRLFAEILDGHRLIGSNSKWLDFATVRNGTWRHGNVVLLGDAAHTAHYSIGPGIKLALEDALALATNLHAHHDVPAALEAYESARKPVASAVQRAARASVEWFEGIDRHARHDPERLAFGFLTRSRRVGYGDLRERDAEFVDGVAAKVFGDPRPPMFQPLRLRGLTLENRVTVSPMGMFCSDEGTPGEFHLVHLGSKALGGAGLVMTEMVGVSPDGRVTPGCTGMYAPGHEAAWRRVTDFVHTASTAAIGLQLGHSGRKGSVRRPGRGADHVPLPDGNWDIVAPSPIPYRDANQIPHALTTAEMDEIRERFAEAARMGARAGFDLLELHYAHGYLLSSFLSPLTNRRTDRYGGTLANRLRFPLEVLGAVRDAWPDDRPVTVRISATDWAEGGTAVDDAVETARALAAHGADAINVSTGQVVPDASPAYGRLYQVPFAERVRNEAGVPVIASGGITSADEVNSIVLAGQADLCALGAAHLADPQWTLRAAAGQGYSGPGVRWPVPFAAGIRAVRPGRGAARR
ncbi:FAD-dependent monooxygenase [Actinomadura sp. CNU-125]|uniref:oxidoreductase n=1 Tax=Actinomadura sp. CNU-125 TaxID=1904961 RepID=UPI00396718EC